MVVDSKNRITFVCRIKRVVSIALVLLVCKLLKLTTPYYKLKIKLFGHV